MARTLPRNADLADQLDLLADLSEILDEESFKSSPTAGRRRGSASRPRPVAELALDGQGEGAPRDREDDRAEGRRGRRGRRDARAHQAARARAGGRRRLPAAPRRRAEDGRADLDASSASRRSTACRRPPRTGRLRELSGMGAAERGEDPRGARGRGGAEEPREDRRPARSGAPRRPRRSSPSSPSTRRRSRSRRRGAHAAGERPSATSTSSRPRPIRAALIAAFCEAHWVAEVVARGDTKATVVGHQGLRFDLRVVPPECYGNVLQHFTGSKDHNIALREDAQRRGLSISEYGVTTSRPARSSTHATEEELYEYLGYASIPPELRENSGELAARPRRRAARARRARRPPRRDALPLDLVGGREEHDRGDGPRGEGARATGSCASPTTRTTCATGGSRLQWKEIDEVNARVKPFRVLRGIEANIRADGSLDVADEVLAELDWVDRVAPHRRSTATRPSGSSARSTTRTSTASGTSRAGGS